MLLIAVIASRRIIIVGSAAFRQTSKDCDAFDARAQGNPGSAVPKRLLPLRIGLLKQRQALGGIGPPIPWMAYAAIALNRPGSRNAHRRAGVAAAGS
ncbi:hypothetical protein [Ralstonia pseudosolanacearum]|uniref:hypothetical protein n=1 Tax=Ralstonia pseudosolanacearum TaxID=1310165 RepID=UPI0018D07FED|nr:hypothetical protein [Ralstonia pseudosolanacearum]